jgi:mono/diheme cytochrome c family protein
MTRAAAIALLAMIALTVRAAAQPTAGVPLPDQKAASANSADPVERGRYLVVLGDCMNCHTVAGGAHFAGGRPLETPFGKILTANITPDQQTGIGKWTADQFYRALHEGRSADGSRLYPAFPYPYFTHMNREETDAILAYLRTIPPVRNPIDRNRLSFPFNIRAMMIGWNALYFRSGPLPPDPAKSPAWNRGAWLVEGPAHCAACHTPTNMLGGRKTSHDFQGGALAGWVAPDVTPNTRTGVGGWSDEAMFRYLKTGRNQFSAASGEMGEAVAFSTSKMSDADLSAIIAYLRDRPASPDAHSPTPDADVMRMGEAVFQDTCSACHRMDGTGVPTVFPRLQDNPNLQQADVTSVLRVILDGTRAMPTGSHPTPLSMPAFHWKLGDEQIAAVATYARNSWGNAAEPVKSDAVAALRKALGVDRIAPPGPEPTDLRHPTPDTLAPANTDSRMNGTPDAGAAPRG